MVASSGVAANRMREANRQLAMFPDPLGAARMPVGLTAATRLLVQLSSALGFSPAARERIKAEPPGGERDANNS